MPFTRPKKVLLHYRLTGPVGAPALAFANSLGTDARIWDEVIAALAPSFRILSYDKRGHGLSDAPSGDYTLEDHVDDLAGLLDQLNIGRIGLVGVSVGGLIAQAFALRHPDRLAGLVLCATAPRMGDARSWAARVAAIREGGMASIADAIMERWFSVRFRDEQPDDLAGWRNMFLRTHVEGYCSTCATLRDTDLSDAVGGIRTPALVVAGEQDGSMTIDMVRACADSISGAKFEVLAGAGHIPSIEQPAELAAMIGDFMRGAGHG